MTVENPSMSSQIILPQPLTEREREIFAAIADRDKEIAERIEEIDGIVGSNLNLAIPGLNYLSNPGFEEGEDNWTLGTGGGGVAEVVSDERASGVKSLHLELNLVTDSAYAWQSIGAAAAGNYVLQFWTRGDGTNAGRYRVLEAGAADPIATTSTGITGTTWSVVSAPFVVTGVGAVTVQLRDPAAASSECWFDDVLITAAITYGNIDLIVYQLARMIFQLAGAWDDS